MANDWDTGAMPEPAPRDHPLYQLWIDGRPATHAPPDRQHAAIVGRALDKAEANPRPDWRWT
jgi:hypothetical protein